MNNIEGFPIKLDSLRIAEDTMRKILLTDIVERPRHVSQVFVEAGIAAVWAALFKLAEESPNGTVTIGQVKVVNINQSKPVPSDLKFRKGMDCLYKPDLTCQESSGCSECLVYRSKQGEY
jgi:hypothetical protein